MRIILVALATLLLSHEGGDGTGRLNDWKKLGEVDGISVYRMKDPDTGAWIYVAPSRASLQVIPTTK